MSFSIPCKGLYIMLEYLLFDKGGSVVVLNILIKVHSDVISNLLMQVMQLMLKECKHESYTFPSLY